MSPLRTSLPAALLCVHGLLCAQGGPANVLVVINDTSSISKAIGEYYAQRRAIPLKNVCHINAPATESIDRDTYQKVAAGVAQCLKGGQLVEQILYIATTAGVPLKVSGSDGTNGDFASVDSELAALYQDIKGSPHAIKGPLSNPFFGKRDVAKFAHPQFPMYLVTRLAAYDFDGVKQMIDRGLQATNRGKFVIDLRSDSSEQGNDWLRLAVLRLPSDRVLYDESDAVVYGQKDVIGYASWGSNDKNHKQRYVGFSWLPGAIATEFVSSNARTTARPPKDWNISTWAVTDRLKWFADSPQTMSLDYIAEGASAATGHVDEPFLAGTPHPEFLFPAYIGGRNLAESFYLSIVGISWQNVVFGDPLMSLGPPSASPRGTGK